MSHPVVWFEVMGKDGQKLRRFYTDLFGWKIDASNPMNYGMVEATQGRGIPGGVGQLGDKPWPGVAFYVSTTDIKGSLNQAGQLASDLGVSDRTIYRDIRDLVASGTPIEGEAGVGYALKREYDLPPLMFDSDELEALTLGARIASAFGDEGLARAASSALSKIESVAKPSRMSQAGVCEIICALLAHSRSSCSTSEVPRVAGYSR